MRQKKRRCQYITHNDPTVMTTEDRLKNLPDFKDRQFDPGLAWVRASKINKK